MDRLPATPSQHAEPALPALVASDASGFHGWREAFFYRGFHVVLAYRVAHWLCTHHADWVARAIQGFTSLVTGCEISRKAVIGQRFRVYHPIGVFIGPHCELGANCVVGPGVFIGSNTRADDPGDYPRIGDGVTVGPGAKVLGPVRVGKQVVIGPNVVVMSDVADRCSVLPPSPRIVDRAKWGGLRSARKVGEPRCDETEVTAPQR